MNVGIAGGGAGVSALATMLVLAGATTTVHEPDSERAGRLVTRIARSLERAGRNAMDATGTDGRGSVGVAVVSVLEPMTSCDIVLEMAGDSLKAKLKLIQELDEACAAPVVLGSVTGAHSVSRLASAARRPERVVGLHFAAPVQSIRLVEVIPGLRTDAVTIRRVSELLRELDRVPILVRNRPGFVLGRISQVYFGEAVRLLEESGLAVETLDAMARGMGFKTGPCESLDAAGLDSALAANRALYDASSGDTRYRPHAHLVELVEAGFLGQKTGRGFYAYEPE